MNEKIIGAIVGGAIALIALHFLRKVWPQTGKWGMNTHPMVCPTCGEGPPTIRRPANRRQMLWGGNTCRGCGTEYDKYGTLVEEESETDEVN